jgi:hypothetical protein
MGHGPVMELPPDRLKQVMEWAAIMALSSKIDVREGSHDKIISAIKAIVDETLRNYERDNTSLADDDEPDGTKKKF